ncbi:MAG: class I SAM-dependent methyltransferase [Lentisphaerae bacterium]|nr:class I SAM-dependent methyltransferase [Lentisphaerota bacterium]
MKMTLDLSQLATNIELDEQGLWHARSAKAISYPEQGSEECFQVEDSSFWFKHRNHCIVDLIAKHPPGGAILDIGGGNGFVSHGLQAAGFAAICLEPSLQGAMNARRRGMEHVVCSSLEDARFKEESLPAAGAFDVLEHVEHEHDFLVSTRELLRPGGRLYLTVPAGPRLWSEEDVLAGHYRRYTTESITTALARAGLEVDYQSYFFSFLVLPVFLSRTVGGSLFRRRGEAIVRKREHQPPLRLVALWLSRLCARERRLLASGKRIKRGTSLLVAARKRTASDTRPLAVS